jgi:hypothetical protein
MRAVGPRDARRCSGAKRQERRQKRKSKWQGKKELAGEGNMINDTVRLSCMAGNTTPRIDRSGHVVSNEALQRSGTPITMLKLPGRWSLRTFRGRGRFQDGQIRGRAYCGIGGRVAELGPKLGEDADEQLRWGCAHSLLPEHERLSLQASSFNLPSPHSLHSRCISFPEG